MELWLVWIPVFLHLVQVQSSPAFDYDEYVVIEEGLCKGLDKAVTLTVNLAERQRLTEELPDSYDPEGYSCAWQVRLLDGGGNTGVVTVVQTLHLRRNTSGGCVDYVVEEKAPGDPTNERQHSGSGTEAGICGRVLFGKQIYIDGFRPAQEKKMLPPGPHHETLGHAKPLDQGGNPWASYAKDGAFVDTKGRFKMKLHIASPAPHPDEKMEITIAHTAYSECNGTEVEADHNSTLFHCGHGLCISKGYVNDGIVNCPFGDCPDETNCSSVSTNIIIAAVRRFQKTILSPTFPKIEVRRSSFHWFTTTVKIFLVLIVKGAVILFIFLVVRCRSNRRKMHPPEVAVCPQNEEGVAANPQLSQAPYPRQVEVTTQAVQDQPISPQGQTPHPQGNPIFHQGHVTLPCDKK